MTRMENAGAQEWPGTGTWVKLLKVEGLTPGNALSPSEALLYSAFKIEKRRAEWLAGRLAAKHLLAITDGAADLDTYEITPDPLGRPSCGQRLLSISHSGGWALAAFRPRGAVFLGADIEKIEPRHPAWYRDYFHPDELCPKGAAQAEPDPGLATRAWTIKEALLKALGLGLMADPLAVKTGAGTIFTGAALKRYREMGSPPFLLETRAWPDGFWTTVAAEPLCRPGPQNTALRITP